MSMFRTIWGAARAAGHHQRIVHVCRVCPPDTPLEHRIDGGSLDRLPRKTSLP
jgi:hypothetical protein